MEDPYVWRDPWEERERGQREAKRAYLDGQNDILERVADDESSAFRGSLRRLCVDMAEQVAWSMHPEWQRSYPAFQEAKRWMRQYGQYVALHPALMQVTAGGKLEMRMLPQHADVLKGGDTFLNVSFDAPSIHYNVRMMDLQTPVYGD